MWVYIFSICVCRLWYLYWIFIYMYLNGNNPTTPLYVCIGLCITWVLAGPGPFMMIWCVCDWTIWTNDRSTECNDRSRAHIVKHIACASIAIVVLRDGITGASSPPFFVERFSTRLRYMYHSDTRTLLVRTCFRFGSARSDLSLCIMRQLE